MTAKNLKLEMVIYYLVKRLGNRLTKTKLMKLLFISDYIAEWMRELRKRTFSDSISKYFSLGKDLNQRDTIAIKRTVSGLLKLLYPANICSPISIWCHGSLSKVGVDNSKSSM